MKNNGIVIFKLYFLNEVKKQLILVLTMMRRFFLNGILQRLRKRHLFGEHIMGKIENSTTHKVPRGISSNRKYSTSNIQNV